MKKILLLWIVLSVSIFAQNEKEQGEKSQKKYSEKEVTFYNKDIELVGTLSLPNSKKPCPAVVLITGSGAQNRDEEILGFKIFGQIAHQLANSGIAVLRYDDRGVGGSSGNITQTTAQESAQDVISGIELLTNNKAIDSKKIGVLGHSEGGVVAAVVAAKTDVAFVVLMAGSTIPGHELLLEQGRLVMLSQGASEEQVAASTKIQKVILQGMRDNQSGAEIEKDLQQAILENLKQIPPQQQKLIGDLDAYASTTAKSIMASSDNKWFRNFVVHNPSEDLAKVKCPVLALFGDLDVQVPFESNSKSLVSAMSEGGNTNYKIKVFESTNHLFQKAKTGAVHEYAMLDKKFTPGFLEFLTSWLQSTTK